MKKSRADFLYRTEVLDGQKVLLIVDQNLGNMSVTNDIENVVEDIAGKENIYLNDHLIIYKDSMGMWDGWDAKAQNFFFLRSSVMRYVGEAKIEEYKSL